MAEDPSTWDTPQPMERPRGFRNYPEILHEIAFNMSWFGWQETVLSQSSSVGAENVLVFPRELSSHSKRTQKTQHEQLVKERTALGNLLLQEEKVARQLRTHLTDLPAGEIFKPFQTAFAGLLFRIPSPGHVSSQAPGRGRITALF